MLILPFYEINSNANPNLTLLHNVNFPILGDNYNANTYSKANLRLIWAISKPNPNLILLHNANFNLMGDNANLTSVLNNADFPLTGGNCTKTMIVLLAYVLLYEF